MFLVLVGGGVEVADGLVEGGVDGVALAGFAASGFVDPDFAEDDLVGESFGGFVGLSVALLGKLR
ncbi:MAG: hypothetical protein LBK28_03240 [Propionibacteriaceae bacterium]|nr:hypothetical protein [Propionibacteriaceae bacterium]